MLFFFVFFFCFVFTEEKRNVKLRCGYVVIMFIKFDGCHVWVFVKMKVASFGTK